MTILRSMAGKFMIGGVLTRTRALSCLAFVAILSSPTPPSAHTRDEDSAVAARGPEAAPAAAVSAALPVTSSPPAPAPQPKPVPTIADFAVNSVLGLDHWLVSGEYAWEEDGVPAGPMKIVVDLAARQLHVYRGGVEIGRSSIMYGDDEKPTPTGIFPILQKKRDHVSNLYGAPMPYMLRLTWDGISIHGAEVRNEYATHGCVGIPDEFAALLYSKAGIGDHVLITNGWMRPNA
jgi:lipoprotein-anchoring transpeptidase ErfK/SrfK